MKLGICGVVLNNLLHLAAETGVVCEAKSESERALRCLSGCLFMSSDWTGSESAAEAEYEH